MEGFTTAIILLRNCYNLFDSHSRDERGLSMIDGTSVLMKFRDFYELNKYLQVAYLEYGDRQQPYFQLQFVEVNVGSIEKVDIYSQYARTVRLTHDREYSADVSRKQKEYYTSLKGSPQHSKMNMVKRQRSKRTYAKMKVLPKYTATINKRKDIKRRRLYESSFDRKVSNFKILIKNGTFFICVICNRYLYRASVICFNIEKYRVDENIIFMVKSYENYYICTTCDKALRKNSVPCQDVANRLNVVGLQIFFRTFVDLKDCLYQEGFCLKR